MPLIIGGEKSPIERVKLATDETNAFEYFAKNVVTATLKPAGEVRVPDSIDWPFPDVTPIDARGWWVYGATWDQRYVDIDYARRKIILKRVGKTEIKYRVENADGTGVDLTWQLDILDKMASMTILIDPPVDTQLNYHMPFSIRASVDGGDYPYTFRWYRGSTLIKTRATNPADPLDKSDRYEVAAVDWIDENTYRVTATDRHGTVVASSTIALSIVADPIVFTGQDETFRLYEDASFNDFINFTGGKPPYVYTWLQDGTATEYHDQTLHIDKLTTADTGKYTLRVDSDRNMTATSAFGFQIYVMDLYLRIAAADTNTANNTTPTVTAREIDVRFDKSKYTQFNYKLSSILVKGGAAGPVTGWEIVTDANQFFTLEHDTDPTKVKFMPHDFGAGTATIRTNDNRSEVCVINADVYTLPIFSQNVFMPLLVTDATGPASRNVTVVATPPLAPEEYQWQRSTDNGVTWSNIAGATALTLKITGPANASEDGRKYRVKADNAFTPKYESVYSKEMVSLYATFVGIDLIRTDSYPTDPLIPGGLYNILRRQNVTDNAAINRALTDGSTAITWTVNTAVSGVVLQETNFKQSVLIAVQTDAVAAHEFKFSVDYANTNGDRTAKAGFTFAYPVVRPSIDLDTFVVSKGYEKKIATMSVPDAFKRTAGWKVEIITPTPSAFSYRFDAATGNLYATGLVKNAKESGVVRLSYYAPGNSNLLTIEAPITMQVKEVIRFRAGEGTAGDKLTRYE